MRWYDGSIEKAVQLSKQKNSIFLVYVSGNDEMSKQMHEMINHPEAVAKLRSDNFVAINLIAGTELYNQFVQIYQLVPVPSMFFIGKNGSPIEVIPQRLEHSEFMSKIDDIIIKGGYEIKSETKTKADAEPSTSKSEKLEEKTPKEETAPEGLTVDEKIERAKILVEQQREAKRREDEEKERQKEIERRKLGQNIQKMKRDQHEQEMKQLREERQREKNEELAARQKILAQIAQDKEERAQKFGQKPPEASPATDPRPVSPRTPIDKSKTRLQFRLSDGSSHTQNFDSEQTLQDVRTYVQENMNLPYWNFDLSTTFPRRQFDEADNARTLLDLELVPNAVILIVPVTQHAVTQAPPSGGIAGFIWVLVTPFLGIYNYVRNFFTSRSQPRPAPPKRASVDNSSVFPPGPSASKRRPTDTTVIRRQGNIHRLADRTERDSDDENNTWNGNSTQQM